MNKASLNIKIIISIAAAAVIGLIGYAYYQISSLSNEVRQLTVKLASTTTESMNRSDDLKGAITALDQRMISISNSLSTADQNIQNTKKSVDSVQSQVGGVEQTVGKISGTVSTLEKLSKTDPELLQKYSKVFFLNEHYAPERLSEIDNKYLYSEKKAELIHSLVLPHLTNMLEAAKAQGVTLYVKSAYRSFDEQKSVKSAYAVVYGKGSANQFSADQGYSEHQLGTTADFTTTGVNGSLSGFEKTPAYFWMQINAHKYGFILSYPEHNDYYIFEPWHWRYVGISLATRLNAERKYFYDLDQREIDKYLSDIFD
ncbi:MAG: VanY protein [Parcubacteria group bacterium]|nr:VanY protein [Parcubacteria group bacterium]